EFTLAAGQILPGFEQAVEGLAPGETANTKIPAAEAYGVRNDEAIIGVPREQLPPDLKPEVGQQLQMRRQDGTPVPVRVTEVRDESITIEGNHALAGMDLSFEIELVEVA